MTTPRTFLITGSSSGIGRATAQAFIDRGHRVIGVCRNPQQFPEHPQYCPVVLDLQRSEDIQPTLKTILRTETRISGVISNAGAGNFRNLEQFSDKQILDTIQLNLTSHILVVRHLIAHLRAQEHADIVLVGSESSLRGGKLGTLYCASKFGLRGFAQSLRQELSASSVRVSMIHPGMVRSNFFEGQRFRPGPDSEHAILADDIAKTICHVVESRPGTVYDELVLSPQKHLIDFSPGKNSEN